MKDKLLSIPLFAMAWLGLMTNESHAQDWHQPEPVRAAPAKIPYEAMGVIGGLAFCVVVGLCLCKSPGGAVLFLAAFAIVISLAVAEAGGVTC